MAFFYVIFYPTASATAYRQRPKFVRAKHTATAEGENWAYGPTLVMTNKTEYYSRSVDLSVRRMGADRRGAHRVEGR